MKKYALASIITILYVPIITIGGEFMKPLKDGLKNIFWHHWLGKSVVLILLYAILVGIFSRTATTDARQDERLLSTITGVAVVSVLTIFVFFTYEYLNA